MTFYEIITFIKLCCFFKNKKKIYPCYLAETLLKYVNLKKKKEKKIGYM